MSEPYDLDGEISSLCASGLRPQILTGVFLKLMTRKFASADGIREPNLRTYLWSPDDTLTQILIVPVYRWTPNVHDVRPAIIIKRNPITPVQIAISDGAGWGGPGAQFSNTDAQQNNIDSQLPMGADELAMAFQGSHTIFTLGHHAPEAEAMATEVYVDLIQFGHLIRNEFGFNKFRVAEVGPIARLEEEHETFAVPITVAYTYIERWKLAMESPYLKTLALELRPNLQGT